MTLGVVTCIDVCYVNIYMLRFHDRWLHVSANGGVGPCYHYIIGLNATQTAQKNMKQSLPFYALMPKLTGLTAVTSILVEFPYANLDKTLVGHNFHLTERFGEFFFLIFGILSILGPLE